MRGRGVESVVDTFLNDRKLLLRYVPYHLKTLQRTQGICTQTRNVVCRLCRPRLARRVLRAKLFVLLGDRFN